MSPSLPARPSLEQLRKQAKKLCRAAKDGEVEAVPRIRPFFPSWTPGSPFKLTQAQLALAREYGFASWRELRAAVAEAGERKTPIPGSADDLEEGMASSGKLLKNAREIAMAVKRENGRVWIEGMEELTWPRGQESSTFRSLAIALQTVGEDVSYEWLMGVSGLAFRVQVMESGLCPSSPHACCGFNARETAFAATEHDQVPHDYHMASRARDKDNPADVAATRRAIVASIDKGSPVLFGSEEDGLVVGYENDGETLLVRSYFDFNAPPGFHPMEDWPWEFGVLEKKEQPVDRRAVVVRSLELAVDLARRAKSGNYHSGFAALTRWIDLLRLEGEEFNAADGKHDMGIQHGNAYIYLCLIDARSRAAGYLRSVADELGEEAKARLLTAAEVYDQVVAGLQGGRANAPFPSKSKDVPWSRDMRLAETDTLTEVAASARTTRTGSSRSSAARCGRTPLRGPAEASPHGAGA